MKLHSSESDGHRKAEAKSREHWQAVGGTGPGTDRKIAKHNREAIATECRSFSSQV